MAYVEPEYQRGSFTCPFCGSLAAQSWASDIHVLPDWQFATRSATCQNEDCKRSTLWLGPPTRYPYGVLLEEGVMVYPVQGAGPTAAVDIPESVKKTYDEAREVLPYSPRAAGALLRLALQQLMVELGERGQSLNDDIANLVGSVLRFSKRSTRFA